MGTIVTRNKPCIDQVGCGSSDARQIYDNGTSYCFSCRKWFPAIEGEIITPKKSPQLKRIPKISIDEIEDYPIKGFQEWKILKKACEFFGVRCSIREDGSIEKHFYPYNNGKSYKVREFPKTFYWIGESEQIFGIERFSAGGQRIVVCEGEKDTLTVASAYLKKYAKIYPVVGLASATFTEGLIKHRDFFRQFDEVVLMMDNDKAGEEALSKAIKIIGIDKARTVKYPANCKDANEVILSDNMQGGQILLDMIWNAAPWHPSGILTKEDLWKALVEYNELESIPYPNCLDGINSKLKGLRLGEIALFISGTGSGKSTIIREIGLHLLETTPREERIGVISLEESPAETARKYAGMAINRNPAFEEIPLEELKEGFDKVFGDDRAVVLDHANSITDGRIIDQLEYLALTGCKYLFIDHITILVSEGSDGATGNEAIDKVMNDLLRVAKRHNVWIGLVSHLRKNLAGSKSFEQGKMPNLDDIRGSGSIKQISFDIIAFTRNLTAETEVERNTIQMAVLKSRYTGLTGNVPGAFYDIKTGRLSASSFKAEEEFTSI